MTKEEQKIIVDAIKNLHCSFDSSAQSVKYEATLVIEAITDNLLKEQTTEQKMQPKGKWINKYKNGNWHCSNCGAIVERAEQDYRNWYYCYHCGKEMEQTDV